MGKKRKTCAWSSTSCAKKSKAIQRSRSTSARNHGWDTASNRRAGISLSHPLENSKIVWDSADSEIAGEDGPVISKADVVRRDPDSAPEHLRVARLRRQVAFLKYAWRRVSRSEEHTSELQSHVNLVCR